ncbi:MAG: hypothetical protein HC834_04265 [Rhodospirillales bacterium]|nr:hypothetical protein [Rhodospirillales bacterium]
MRAIETVEEARQHIEANLLGLAKSALDKSKESRQRYQTEADDHLKNIWKQEADSELRIAKLINDECDALLSKLASR